MTTIEVPKVLEPVENYIDQAHLAAFDGCHKIYLALDETQADWFREEYPHVAQGSPDIMLATVVKWYEESCFLKFVEGVTTNAADPNAGFTQIVPQGAEEEQDEDCYWCGGDCEDEDACHDEQFETDDEEE